MKELIYKIINVFTLGRGIKIHISGFSLKLPARYFRYFGPDYELNNINFINNYVTKGMIAIDVGSHIGLLSTILAKKVEPGGKVLSLEPTPSTFKLLKKTIAINNVGSTIIPINKAISERSGVVSFYITKTKAHNSNSLANNNRAGTNEIKIEVESISINDLVKDYNFKKLDLIKIDAEGAEYAVLKSAGKTLDEFHPKIILALHPDSIKNFGDDLSQIWDFIFLKNYKVFYNNDQINKEEFISKTDLFDVFLL